MVGRRFYWAPCFWLVQNLSLFGFFLAVKYIGDASFQVVRFQGSPGTTMLKTERWITAQPPKCDDFTLRTEFGFSGKQRPIMQALREDVSFTKNFWTFLVAQVFTPTIDKLSDISKIWERDLKTQWLMTHLHTFFFFRVVMLGVFNHH